MDRKPLSLSNYKDNKVLNEEKILFRYNLEKQVMDAITAGDYHSIETIQEDHKKLPFDPKVIRLLEDELRDRKNGMVIRNTFSRIAAREGGLPPVYLHMISETYALKIEQATSKEYLDEVLSNEMFKDYCEAVKQFSTLGYSEVTKKIVSYISNRPMDSLSLQEAANEFHINAAHLSRKFKKETGMNFTEYVNHQRVEYAKLLFHEGELSITEVSSLSGFSSSSYFSKVFKSITGESPTGYISKHT